MKRGETLILAGIGVLVAGLMVRNFFGLRSDAQPDRGIPFYTTASPALARTGGDLYRVNNCRQCHSLWSVKSPFESVPAPVLDGIGTLRSEEWLYQYFSAPDPQSILPSRLKPEYRMPSFKDLPDTERRALAQYMASLKVKDWYRDAAKAAEYEKLTGKAYPGGHGEN